MTFVADGRPPFEWYVARDGQQHGPLTEQEFDLLESQAHLRETDLVWNPGLSDWMPYGGYLQRAATQRRQLDNRTSLLSLKKWGAVTKITIYSTIAISTAFAILSFIVEDKRLLLSYFFWPLMTSQALVGVVGGLWLRRALINLKRLTCTWLPMPAMAFLFAGPQTVFVIASAVDYLAKSAGQPLSKTIVWGPLYQWPMLAVIICSWFLLPFLLQRVHRLSTQAADGFVRTRSAADVWVFFACWFVSSFGFKEQLWGWGGAVLCACISNGGSWLLRGVVEDISNSQEMVIHSGSRKHEPQSNGPAPGTKILRYSIAAAKIAFLLIGTFNDLPLIRKMLQ